MSLIVQNAARKYVDQGWSVLPLHEGSKEPSIKWAELRTRKPSPAEVRSWFTGNAHNIGIICGSASGIVVVDLDSPTARETLEGAIGESLPATRTVRTARGMHLYFRAPQGKAIKNSTGVVPGVDVRAEGGYVVAPPSIHETGYRYAWEDEEQPIAELPDALLSLLLAERKSSSSATSPRANHIPEGTRNDTLASVAGRLINRGWTRDAVESELQRVNSTDCDPPLPTGEVHAIVESIYTREQGKRRPLSITPLSEIEPEETAWLWQGHIARQHLTVIDGQTGQGKSLVLADLIARLTMGRHWPDNAPLMCAGRAVLVQPEDHAPTVIVPRLKAAGADLSRVTILGEEDAPLQLPRDLDRIMEAVRALRPDLVVFDPYTMFTGLDPNSQLDVVKMLDPLRTMAEELNCAVVATRHLRKKQEGGALNAGAGSFAVNAIARTVMYLGSHFEQKGVRVLTCSKNNLGPPFRSQSFTIETPADLVSSAPKINWLGSCELTADDLATAANAGGATGSPEGSRTPAQEACEQFIRERLQDGPLPWTEFVQSVEAAGHAQRTRERVTQRMKLERYKQEVDGQRVERVRLPSGAQGE